MVYYQKKKKKKPWDLGTLFLNQPTSYFINLNFKSSDITIDKKKLSETCV